MKNTMKTLVAIALTIAVFHHHEVLASISYWNNGTGVGSKTHWDYGQGAGSKTHWDYGQGAGSKTHWDYGQGAGSKFYWEHDTGTESLDDLKFVCYGLMVSKTATPDICMIYPELEEMN